ncbi:hypothetical protein [Dyadobacter sp. 676]|uniref:Uncharacterized protein n=1 Tax=Dyadobacter sp. 676 TaxID=3088362 RepID=A0AAU8FSK5_9BACT
MKNGITLIIASVLLLLCVMQKEARYGTAQHESVEKMYNASPVGTAQGKSSGSQYADQLLTDSQSFEFASADTTLKAEPTARLANQRLLHISANSKMLNY